MLAAARQVLVDWNRHKKPFLSAPHAAHVPFTIPGHGHGPGPGTAQVVAPGAEMAGNAQYVSALGAPFMLEGLFGEADAEAMMDADAGPTGRRSASGLLPFSAGMEVDNR